MSVLVTGGCGFIGSHLVDRLIADGKKVIVLDRERRHINKAANYITCDLCDLEVHELSKFLDVYKVDTIFHLAAEARLRWSFENPALTTDNNLMATVRLAEAARGKVDNFVFASTGGAMYDQAEPLPWTENTRVDPLSPYALSKLCAEQFVKMILPDSSTILRLANVYGPRQDPYGEAGVVAIFMNNILEGRPCSIFGDGHQERDYVYVEDVVDAFARVYLRQEKRSIFNVSTGESTSLNSLTLKILASLGESGKVEFAEKVPGEMEVSRLSYLALACQTKWYPLTSLDDGLKKTADWFAAKASRRLACPDRETHTDVG